MSTLADRASLGLAALSLAADRASLGLAALSLAALAACSSAPKEPEIGGAAAKVVTADLTSDQLRQLVREASTRFGLEIRAASRSIEQQAHERSQRRLALGWKIVSIDYIDAASFLGDPRVALIDVWTLALQMREYFGSSPGSEAFGEWTQLALRACENASVDMEALAKSAVKPDSFEELRATVLAFAQQHPMGAAFTRHSPRVQSAPKGASDHMGAVFDTAMMPLRAIGGMDETAVAIHHAAGVMADAVEVSSRMPERLHWQVQLLAYDLEGLDTVTAARDSLNAAAVSTTSLADTARTLPQDLRQQVSEVLVEFDQRQAGIQKTLQDAQATLTTADRVVVDAQTTLQALEKASATLDGTLEEFRGMIGDFAPDPNAPPKPPGEASRPFDVNEYTRGLEELTRAAAQLDATLASVRALTAPTGEARSTLASVGSDVERTALRLALLLLGTVLGLLALLLGYRLALRRAGLRGRSATDRA